MLCYLTLLQKLWVFFRPEGKVIILTFVMCVVVGGTCLYQPGIPIFMDCFYSCIGSYSSLGWKGPLKVI